AFVKVNAIEAAADGKRTELRSILSGAFGAEAGREALADWPDQPIRPVVKRSMPAAQAKPPERPSRAAREEIPADPVGSGDFRGRQRRAAELLKRAAAGAAEVKGLQGTARGMRWRAERLRRNRFTVALFGAFSAGKSSFANAMMGDGVLPVSPNPTTAAINQISPVDEEHPHRTARIRLKTESDLLEDVRKALKPFGRTVKALDELSEMLEGLKPEKKAGDSVRQATFLQSVSKGLETFGDILGEEQHVDIETFYERVSNEDQACMIESIELYYDCPLTRQGITLVDTPGADSVNARHTGVAFEYIKNADAVLFVTYYNHAFSRADREFLIQLGRVKDSFAMDKMFFVVNASDLAASQDELDTVVDYVEENLITHGIRNPRIYPISSQQALEGKKQTDKNKSMAALKTSGIADFENDFTRFTMGELTNIAVEEARGDIRRAVRTMETYLSAAREDEDVRKQKREAVFQTKQDVMSIISETGTASEIQALQQEIDQLVYYVNQRVFLRYHDLFKETFNPAALGDIEHEKKQALRACLGELLERIGFDLAQEMRATALRAETFSKRSLKGLFDKIKDKTLKRVGEEFFSAPDQPVFTSPEFENALEALDPADFDEILKVFKNTKQFFAKDGKSKMHGLLEERLRQPVQSYLDASAESMKRVFRSAYKEEAENVKRKLKEQTDEYFEGEMAALSMEIDPAELERRKNELTGILNEFA
ncbi:MAG TPA: dynamin family protein, partial [Bacillales bacterium]|nr:dynamin family protein [Bacillales bacterium]